VNPKRLCDAAVLRALHGIEVGSEDEVKQTDTPNFDGGPRIDYNARSLTPGDARHANAVKGVFGPFPSGERGWVEYEIEGGADLFFGRLGS
jgi:hypothetical protein